jgi:ribosome biogenesis GTPase
VGKTSLINALTGQDMAVNDVVRQTRKGSHTTTTTTLVPLESGGWCVDTPGIKSFGLWNLEQDELEAYFTEIREVGAGCKFPNCTHRHEPKCAVKEAVDEGHLSILRYQSYLGLMEALEEEHRRR